MSKPFMRKLNPFKPTDIAACSLWLDAADRSTFTLSGLNILQWNDKSGLGRNATAVGTIPLSSSINGISTPGYSLNNNTYFSGTSINTGTTLSAFAVYIQNANSTGNNRIVSLGTIGTLDWNNISSISAILMIGPNFVSYRNSNQLGTIAGTFGVPSLSSSISTGQSNTFYLNGRAGTTVASSGNFNYSTYFIGSTVGEQNFSALSGTVGEVILYNTALTDPQREKVEGYLAQKWGLQPNLPAGSPGRTGVIYPRSPLIDSLTTGQPTRKPFIRSRAILQTRIFNYTGALQDFLVPATTSSITVYMWGAGGGGYFPTQSYGGAGCYLTGTLPVTGGETLRVLVGQAGTIQFPAQTGVATRFGGGGGIISTGGNGNAQFNGSGGGRSAIQRSSVDIVSAGAGGGCGTQAGGGNGHNGGTGSWTGTGGNGADDKFGLGGTQTAGGASQGNGLGGTALVGGRADPWGGGGGGGFFGGGAGSDNGSFGSGGGGGSSYTGLLSNASGSNGTLNVAPATNSPYYVSGVAVGGTQALSGNGGPGLVVITYFA
jgi:hypothetical protein